MEHRLGLTALRLAAMEENRIPVAPFAYSQLCLSTTMLLRTCSTSDLYALLSFLSDSLRSLTENVLFERLGYLPGYDLAEASRAKEITTETLRRVGQRS